MKLTLTKHEVLLLQKLLYSYKENFPDGTTDKHERFVGKLNKKIKRQVINQIKKITCKLQIKLLSGLHRS